VAARAARLSDPSRGPSSTRPSGGVIKPPDCPKNRDRYISTLQPTRMRGMEPYHATGTWWEAG
jgi:hypothetical protein